jgi:hypothetical protein
MQRRHNHGDDSDEDEGFKLTNSGRLRGALPVFLPSIAKDKKVIEALYRCHPRPRDPADLTDDHPAVLRKKIIMDMAARERRPKPAPQLPPLATALQQRRRNEVRMEDNLRLRLANSSPALDRGMREMIVMTTMQRSRAKLEAPKTKGWSKAHLAAGYRPQCRSCPPTIGVSDHNAVPLDPAFRETPWKDPALERKAIELEKAEVAANKARRMADERDGEGRTAALKAAKQALRIPVNDETAAGPGYPVYHYHRSPAYVGSPTQSDVLSM